MRNTNNQTWKSGDRVKVEHKASAPSEHGAEGRCGRFVEYTEHGFARVALDPKPEWKDQSDDLWLIHPENLVSEYPILCSVEGCAFYANDLSYFCPSHF